MDSNIDEMSIIELLEILDVHHDELISRTSINEIIRTKMDATSNLNKKQLLQRIYTRLNKYLDDLGLNSIFRVDDLLLNKNVIDQNNDKFIIEKQGMNMQNTFIHTVADGELNPLKKRTKSYILHLNTKHREKNSSNRKCDANRPKRWYDNHGKVNRTASFRRDYKQCRYSRIEHFL